MTSGSPLIERAVELEVLSAAVAGGGGVVVVEGAAGLGKTALLEHGALLAAQAGFLVRRAAPGPLERHFPFGAIRALLEAPLREASDRARLLEGAAAPAGELLLDGSAPRADSTMLMAHSVLWLCSALARQRPLAFVVDDAQRADRPSLEVLSYLACRIADLPLLVLLAARPDDPSAATDLLTLLGATRSTTVLPLQPLTVRGGLQLLRRLAPATPTAACVACHRAAGGNPWLLGELGRQAAAYGPAAIGHGAPTATARTVVRQRLAELSARDRGVAEALAVIGDGAPPQVVATVAGIPLGELRPVRDALLAAGLLAEDQEGFAHGLIATAITDDLPRTERERLHREAALALTDARADSRLVACHLLECGPQADPAVSACLQEAARLAPAPTAVAYLERALAEGAPGDDRGDLLAQLGTVSFDAGLPDARRRLRAALGEVRDHDSRIGVLTRLAALNLLDAADDDLEQELARESDPGIRLAVEAASLDALLSSDKSSAERARRVAAVDLSRSADPLLERVILAHRAWAGVERGTPDADACAALALQALEHDLLLGEAHWRAAYALCARVLVATDHPHAGPAIAAMREAARERGSLRLRVAAEWYAADFALRTGRVAEAERLARLALDLLDSGRNVLTAAAVEVLALALAERGAFAQAREVLCEHGPEGAPGVLHASARLSLAEGDFDRAYAEAVRLGELRSEQGRPNPSLMPWRSIAARALAHLGCRTEAAAVADAELALAERFGAPVPIAVALHARAQAEPDPAARIRLCKRGLSVGVAASGLEVLRLRIELGATLASQGRRFDARAALRPALADADAVGAVLLAQRARRELVATGLRPRHAALEGAAALTPRQRQICELAAGGKSNRAIARELFLSVKTIEAHLAAGYRKLGVATRAELAAELAA